MIKKIFYSLLILLVLVLIWQYKLVGYGISQAYGQLRIIYNTQPIDEYLTDPDFPDSLKQKLILIQEIKRFAVDSLGIKDSKNYTTVYNQHGKPILWVVTACPPYELKPKEWHFPLLGKFSYKGFFDYPKAQQEEKLLKKEGLDTEIDEVSGWSTLGWLKDPILTNWLSRSEGQLANLIIHELTHGTLYVKNNVEYNENLASFVGDQGALLFLTQKYGKDSKQYRKYLENKIFREKYSDHILRGTFKLDSLFKTFQPTDADEKKKSLKYQLIARIMQTADTLTVFGKPKALAKEEGETLPNNTYFMSYVRYRSKQNQFDIEFRNRFQSDFKKYLAYLKNKYPSL